MSKDKKTWIQIFTVSSPQDHPSGFTVYKVVRTTFPVSSPELAVTLTCWKRWSQFQSLHKILQSIHKSLFLAGDLPALPKTAYFNRKEQDILEERIQFAQSLLEFAAGQPLLCNSTAFADFFTDGDKRLEAEALGGAARIDTDALGLSNASASSARSSKDLGITVSHDLSIDTTPTLTPTPGAMSLSPSPPLSLQSPSSPQLAQSSATSSPEDPPTAGAVSSGESSNSVPAYITEAAELVSAALRLEAEERLGESIGAYRSAIGKLLSHVQTDPDSTRQSAVKKRIAQYIFRAEQLVQQELELRTAEGGRGANSSRRGAASIPHLQLFGQLAELRQYKVTDILDRKIIIAHRQSGIITGTSEGVVFKVLHKSAAVHKRSKTSLLPINISYMVQLLKYYETDDAVILMLEYCPTGKLWDLVKPLVEQQPLLTQQQLLSDSCQQQPQLSYDSCHTSSSKHSRSAVGGQMAVMRPSPSFIMERQAASLIASHDVTSDVSSDVTAESSESEESISSDLSGDISFVLAENSSLLVVSNNQIAHYECEEEVVPSSSPPSIAPQPSPCQSMEQGQDLLHTLSTHLYQAEEEERLTRRILAQAQTVQDQVASHLSGNFDKLSLSKSSSSAESAPQQTEALGELPQEASTPPCPLPEVIFSEPLEAVQDSASARPNIMRKLSEVLPRCPDPDLEDVTYLPDRLIRLWAAELAQVLTSLHYRDIIIKDLNPGNVLLDGRGHIKLTYQCEWVSVERKLSTAALQGRYTAPEVLGVGEITPAADWWSYGAILHLLYTGSGPSSLLPTGLDSTIPLQFPSAMCGESINFITSLLKVQPEERLGAGSQGSLDVRNHPYFSLIDWDKIQAYR